MEAALDVVQIEEAGVRQLLRRQLPSPAPVSGGDEASREGEQRIWGSEGWVLAVQAVLTARCCSYAAAGRMRWGRFAHLPCMQAVTIGASLSRKRCCTCQGGDGQQPCSSLRQLKAGQATLPSRMPSYCNTRPRAPCTAAPAVPLPCPTSWRKAGLGVSSPEAPSFTNIGTLTEPGAWAWLYSSGVLQQAVQAGAALLRAPPAPRPHTSSAAVPHLSQSPVAPDVQVGCASPLDQLVGLSRRNILVAAAPRLAERRRQGRVCGRRHGGLLRLRLVLGLHPDKCAA